MSCHERQPLSDLARCITGSRRGVAFLSLAVASAAARRFRPATRLERRRRRSTSGIRRTGLALAGTERGSGSRKAVPRDAAPTEFAGAGPMGSSRAEFDGVPNDMVRRLSGTESGPGRSSRSPGDAGKRAAAGAVPIRSRRDQRRRTQGEIRDCGPAAGPPGGDLSASQGNRDDENRSRIRDA